ncbi:MAG: T9SS type A sorting domain-containing protein, partial [Lentimicrobium sp.]|nr:T9SS type A sorting domain-containing protein [Lentimicrobium sp.]
TLSVTPANQNVTAAAGNTTFDVTSNSAWSASSDAAWCTVTPSGSGNGIITASYTQNTSTSSRVASVSVTVAGLTPIAVTVTQAGTSPVLSVTPANQNVGATAGSTGYSVTSNSAWTVISNASWCTVTPSGSGNGIITSAFSQNISTADRIAEITVSVSGLTPVLVTLTQAGTLSALTVTPANQNVPAVAGNTTFSVISNSAWTASSDATWCTVTPSGNGNGTFTAVFTENVMAYTRIANVTVTITGISPVVVTVTQQAPVAVLVVNPDEQTVAYQAGSVAFDVISNVNWTSGSDADWCQSTPSGSGNGLLTVLFHQNDGIEIRTAIIQVNSSVIGPVAVQVIQMPFPVSVDEHPENNILIYPNPTTGIFVISGFSNEMFDMKVSITDISGKEVMKRECFGASAYTFDLSGNGKGNYFMKAEAGGKVLVWKIVLQ